MFNEELMRERRPMVIQQLIYDSIYNLKIEIEEVSDIRSKRDIEVKIRKLYKIYNNVDSVDVTLMSKNDKEKVIELLEKRINSIEIDMLNDKEETCEMTIVLKDFILYEYKVLLRDFLGSLISDKIMNVEKNSN